MRIQLHWLSMAAAAAIGCSSSSIATAPTMGGGGGGGPVGSVTVGNIFFQSGKRDPESAIDTVSVGTTVTWTWTDTGSESHSVQSQGTPSFTSSDVLSGDGKTYTMTFMTAGTYQYDCAIHGSLMTGRIVVQ